MRKEYTIAETKRRVKQLLVFPMFVAILAVGWFYPLLGLFIPVCMLLGIGFAMFKGRKWCDWYCPRGSFYDVLMTPMSPKKHVPGILKGMPFRLTLLGFLMIIMAVNVLYRWPSLSGVGVFFIKMLTVTTVAGIILALMYHPRAWCMMCPIGTLSGAAGRNRQKLFINSTLCIECKTCHRVCPVHLAPYKYRKEGVELVAIADCLKCNLCISACPTKALRREKGV